MINFNLINFNTINHINTQKKTIKQAVSFKGIDTDIVYINKRNDNRFEENFSSSASSYKPFLSEDDILLKIRKKNDFLNDDSIFLRYKSDFEQLANATYESGEPIFKRKSSDTTKMINSLYTRRKDAEFRGIRSPQQIDYDAIQNILNVKYSDSTNEKTIDKLLKKLQKGEITTTQLKMYSYMLYTKTLSPMTVNKLSDKDFQIFRESVSSWDKVLDDEKLSKIYDVDLNDKLSSLKQKMGREFYSVKWVDLIDKKSTKEELSALIEDMPQLYKREKLKLNPENFYVKMRNYGANEKWAERMCQISDYATELIRNNESFSYVLNEIAEEGAELHYDLFDGDDFVLAENFGQYRENQDNLYTPFSRKSKRYGEYAKKFKNLAKQNKDKIYSALPLKEFEETPTTKIKLNYFNGEMLHPSGDKTFITLHYVKQLYDKIMKTPNKKIIFLNENIAKMHWVFAQGMPFKRGSDSIANILVKSIYRANDVKVFGPKEGISFDMEAFSSDCGTFVEKYPYLYELPPAKKKF